MTRIKVGCSVPEEVRTVGLRALVLIKDPDLEELIRDLLRPDDEVLAAWPPSQELRRDGVELLVADEDEILKGSPVGELVRRWAAELPTIFLGSRLVGPRREGCCLVLPKPIPLRLFVAFVDELR